MALSIDDFGRLIVAKRGSRGVRAVAADVGVSPATLSRVENGNLPDLETFAKLCTWLDRDPAEFLGVRAHGDARPDAVVHFRKKRTVPKETAISLGEMILAAQRAVQARDRLLE
jgi:transcriptional regulator with XRE-family HTH domain